MGDCSMTRSTPGAVLLPHQRDQEAARSNKRASLIPVPVTSQSGAHKRLLTKEAAYKLRVHDGLLVANMFEDHHEGVFHAACGR
jgi:hypothetical protein